MLELHGKVGVNMLENRRFVREHGTSSGSLVSILGFQCRGGGFDPWSVIPAYHGVWSKITKTKKRCFVSNQKWKFKRTHQLSVFSGGQSHSLNKAIKKSARDEH